MIGYRKVLLIALAIIIPASADARLGDIPFMRSTVAESEKVSVNAPDWTDLTNFVTPFTGAVAVFRRMAGDTQIARIAVARFFIRAVPLNGVCQARLVSYYYDASGIRQYDHGWPPISSTPGFLSNMAQDVTAKLNGLLTLPADALEFNVMVQVKGVCDIFGARLEMS